MAERNKVWVIDDGKRPELTSLGDPLETAPRPAPPPPRRRLLPRPPRPARPAPIARAAEPPRPRPVRTLHSATLLGLAYLLGPGNLLLTRRGRTNSAWTALTASWAAVALALGLGWWAVASGRTGGALVPWLAGGTFLAVAWGFTLWARGLHLAVTGERMAAHAWSPRATHPWSAVGLGLVAPGSAQVLAHRPRRAVAVLWGAWPFAAAVLALLQLPLLWAHRSAFAAWGLDAAAVERGLLVAAALAAVAPLLWLAQALEGARVLAARSGRWSEVRGDWSAVALAAALVAAVVVVDPGTIAAGLGDYAGDLAADGCTVTPLLLVRTARQLDPAQPAYALQEADLYAAAGSPERARQVRADLDRTLQPYVGALLRDERHAKPAPAVARPRAVAAPVPVPASEPRPQPTPPREFGAASLLLPAPLPVASAGPPAPGTPTP